VGDDQTSGRGCDHTPSWRHQFQAVYRQAMPSERCPAAVVVNMERSKPDAQLASGGLVEMTIAQRGAGGGELPDVSGRSIGTGGEPQQLS
jgi:hypothetical protein